MSIVLGSVEIELKDIAGFLANKLSGKTVAPVTWDKSIESIVWDIRFPRVFVAFFVGAGLTLCGIIMQALTKNTLADPYVLGISQGASSGAVFMIMYGSLFFLRSTHDNARCLCRCDDIYNTGSSNSKDQKQDNSYPAYTCRNSGGGTFWSGNKSHDLSTKDRIR